MKFCLIITCVLHFICPSSSFMIPEDDKATDKNKNIQPNPRGEDLQQAKFRSLIDNELRAARRLIKSAPFGVARPDDYGGHKSSIVLFVLFLLNEFCKNHYYRQEIFGAERRGDGECGTRPLSATIQFAQEMRFGLEKEDFELDDESEDILREAFDAVYRRSTMFVRFSGDDAVRPCNSSLGGNLLRIWDLIDSRFGDYRPPPFPYYAPPAKPNVIDRFVLKYQKWCKQKAAPAAKRKNVIENSNKVPPLHQAPDSDTLLLQAYFLLYVMPRFKNLARELIGGDFIEHKSLLDYLQSDTWRRTKELIVNRRGRVTIGAIGTLGLLTIVLWSAGLWPFQFDLNSTMAPGGELAITAQPTIASLAVIPFLAFLALLSAIIAFFVIFNRFEYKWKI